MGTGKDLFRLAFEAHGRGQLDEAAALYGRCLAANPRDFDALNLLGAIALQTRRPDRAIAVLDRAIAINPGFADAHYNRGNALWALRRLDEAVASFDRAIALDPGDADFHNNRGNTLVEMRRYDEAMASFDRAIAADPDHAGAHGNKAMCLIRLGDYAAGWKMNEWRKKVEAPRLRGGDKPEWSGIEPIAGRTLFLHWEGGLGDTLHFCRYARVAREAGANVVLSVQEPLIALMRRMNPSIQVIGPDQEPAAFDFHASLMSLPFGFGTDLANIPYAAGYLRAAPERAAVWRRRLAQWPGRKVGLVWAGASRPDQPVNHAMDQRRSMTLHAMAPLASVGGVCFVSLQKGETAGQARAAPKGMALVDWTDELTDFDDTAALVAALDLVITVDTSCAHLAGGLGKPVWVLNRFDPCWRWLVGRTDSPWYHSMRLFGQSRPGDWTDVMEGVRIALQAFVDGAGADQTGGSSATPSASKD